MSIRHVLHSLSLTGLVFFFSLEAGAGCVGVHTLSVYRFKLAHLSFTFGETTEWQRLEPGKACDPSFFFLERLSPRSIWLMSVVLSLSSGGSSSLLGLVDVDV